LTARVYGPESANAFGMSEITSAIIARNKVAVKIVSRYVLFIRHRPIVVVITLMDSCHKAHQDILQHNDHGLCRGSLHYHTYPLRVPVFHVVFPCDPYCIPKVVLYVL
jgi:hypothetical protein